MVGQKDLIQRIDSQIERNVFPKFSIIIGPSGSGKRTLSEYISDKMGVKKPTYFENSVSSIRSAIQMAYKASSKTIFVFADADTMSNAAKNALLKITEEPPKNVWFIMTLQNEGNTLETILSRGTKYLMQPYSYNEIGMYAVDKVQSEEALNIIRDVCTTIGDVNKILDIGPLEMYQYVEKVVDNIAEVSGANVFKISDKVSLKDDKGYDLKLFWNMFVNICIKRADLKSGKVNKEEVERYVKAVKITCESLKELQITGINKSGLFDLWILDVRKVWL